MLKTALLYAGAGLAVFLATGWSGFQSRIHAIPYEEMARIEALMKSRGATNTMVLSPPVTPQTPVPRNNPDTRPTYCWVDLSEGPVRVSGPLPESYWSLSVYTPDSLNPFVASDRDFAPAQAFDFIVARLGEAPQVLPDSARLIEIDALKAAVLLRYYVPRQEDIEQIDALRWAARCAPYSPE
ncbi:DUF1254 domain-containing protein [Erythrobacter sp. HL-111]|uniref:DUF1254 domain-containing protein n=1 Tax=Erythrobacter sp. HL-111 TaxID=1798193 RepID=UPI0006DB34B8|nr:DUF1254 domain-containing protein [Erythrobacter sp. HL-111]KPP81447.1 MAG: Protein of unknown function (DUF1254) [Erythrobacteraceae bacterium HL-111]SDS96494.1 Uncharacterized membrane protein [Erythrobacter sp. HL-111]